MTIQEKNEHSEEAYECYFESNNFALEISNTTIGKTYKNGDDLPFGTRVTLEAESWGESY